MRIDPLTRDRFIKLEGHPPPMTVKGLCVTDGDEVFAAVGVAVIAGENFIFCGVKDGCHKKKIVEVWRKFSDLYMQSSQDYYAIIDESIPKAKGLLSHFGFEQFKDDIYIYRR